MMLALPDHVTKKVDLFKQMLKVCEREPFMDYEKRTFDQEWCHVISGNHTQKLVEQISARALAYSDLVAKNSDNL